jgi:NAD-dependent dihydropyrimidine dehydrogenase PreA subunit/flavodoxin
MEDLKMSLKIALIYFSGTNVTRTYAGVIREELNHLDCEVETFDVTPFSARQRSLPLKNAQAAIFGFPVYADFAPSVINDWLPSLEGGGKRCAMFFTYGARTTGYSHFHTKLLLEEANFQVLFSAEFLGRHTFNVGGWNILPHRPDESDFKVARDFASLAVERFSMAVPPTFKLQKPFCYHLAIADLKNQIVRTEPGMTNPFRVEIECSMCRDCENECPTQSFNADTGNSNPETCIECMHCLYICPDKVIKIDERMADTYQDFLTYCHLDEEMMAAKSSKIITESWQAAF